MTPFTDLPALMRRWHRPAVRDLAWTLCSPPMLQSPPCAQRHPLSGSAWTDDPQRLVDWLDGLEVDDQPLRDWLARITSRRLGLYYEGLWQFALRHAPGVELLAANLPIRRGGLTLGELDILLRDREGVHHVELAIKFYLGPTDTTGQDPLRWIGPGCHDRLGHKLAHLAAHQLPMSTREESREALAQVGICDVQAHLWLGGYLFYPWQCQTASPAGVSGQHLRGHWLRHRQWAQSIPSAPAMRWQPLPRHAWLAPARVEAALSWEAPRFEAWRTALDESASAQMLVQLEQADDGAWEEVQRVFLVPDNWPDPLL